MRIAFGEDGEPILAVDPAEPFADEEAQIDRDDENRLRLETVFRTVAFLSCGGLSERKTGRRWLMIAFLLRLLDCRDQRALARRLRLSPSRVSRALRPLRAQLGLLGEWQSFAEGAKGHRSPVK